MHKASIFVYLMCVCIKRVYSFTSHVFAESIDVRLPHECLYKVYIQGVPEYLQPKYIQIVYYTGQQLQKILHFLEAEMITIRKLKI